MGVMIDSVTAMLTSTPGDEVIMIIQAMILATIIGRARLQLAVRVTAIAITAKQRQYLAFHKNVAGTLTKMAQVDTCCQKPIARTLVQRALELIAGRSMGRLSNAATNFQMSGTHCQTKTTCTRDFCWGNYNLTTSGANSFKDECERQYGDGYCNVPKCKALNSLILQSECDECPATLTAELCLTTYGPAPHGDGTLQSGCETSNPSNVTTCLDTH